MKGIKKEHLPEKICAACGRPFTWRKKWEKVWDEVKYCSDKCRKNKPANTTPNGPTQRSWQSRRRTCHSTLAKAGI